MDLVEYDDDHCSQFHVSDVPDEEDADDGEAGEDDDLADVPRVEDCVLDSYHKEFSEFYANYEEGADYLYYKDEDYMEHEDAEEDDED